MKQLRNWLILAALISSPEASLTRAQQSQPTPPSILVKAGRLLDPRTGNVLAPAAVLVEDGKIKEVGSPSQLQVTAPAGVKIIDLGSATLLPGLIDSHTHLFMDIVILPEVEQ